ncbi:MAG: rRNA adenine N(6)-methyltransferase family protein [Conexivisphaerales archaeon]
MKPGDKHFLNYEWIPIIVSRIPTGVHLFEIGTGNGNITEPIAKIAQNVRTFEIDNKLYKIAIERLSQYQNVQIYNADALSNVPFVNEVVFSDLPFSQSRHFIDWIAENYINDIYVVVQKEFYNKMTAETGTRKYGAVSVIVQFLFDVKKIIDIPASAYTPPPAVSAVYLSIKRIKKCTFSKNEIILIRNFMSNKTSKSRIDGKRVFQLKPEEVIREVGIRSC